MKDNLIKYLFALTLTLSLFCFSSCKKYLDKSPLSDISDTEAYKNFTNFQGFTEELYNCIPLISTQDYHNNWNFGEDEMWEIGETRLLAYAIDQGDFWGWNTSYYSWFKTGGNGSSQNRGDKGHLWGLSWYAIRKANIGIANLDKLTDATQEEKDLIAGQLYFFRGWFHFMLMQYWGGLPYVDQVIPADQPIKLERLNYQQTADKAAEDFQKAADLLPIDWDETLIGKQTLGNNNIRINKIMALAYLGKDLLWAGSPLMNRESTGNSDYNKEYCEKAADAFAKALQLSETTGRYQLADFSQYSQLFYTFNQSGKLPGLKESIFTENLIGAENQWRWNQVNDYRPMTIDGSGIKVNPTANYVDYYGMKNGLPITDPASGFDPTHPWKDRDPRFYHDITFDGVKCVINGGNVGNDDHRQYASLYTGGLYRTANGNKAVLTGYMETKFVSQYMNDWDGFKDNNVFILSLMRLSDVYLMYAEATAEGYGTPQSKASGYGLSAVDAVNKIRERAGVEDVNSKFLNNINDFMGELRRERAVELAFEGHRFTDLRRWLLLTESPYTLKKAVEFDRDMPDEDIYADPVNEKVKNFREVTIVERHLSQKHYWFPFLTSDVNLYPGFKQNPGW
ncbi:RagB/SusD family nutrient uptake outer membrane protein [Arachidicoccus ginsenosidivorans]|uniref:RagB/SusD family nutrient uptake outer membrane protein n=1 Tax=Arachidicoccus ginsenosidivorans TaxID=496057 RepID=A0A5B8VJ69_9BACT|nr:RagB/SusD family nutrient uptake outer membrane protein [Arachidicoccus ginsenosidivorans]QEC71637.1 RagB/SusD family nutrient uptake outer membrane protein [Arachidicoccus ginsenosidivorans]